MEGKCLILMVGLPYSGKSTEAKAMSKEHEAPIVCPDTIRIALHGKKFIPETEPYVWAIAKTMVKALFLSGHNTIILDATNTSKERRDAWDSKEWNTTHCYIETDVDTCKQRAKDAGDDVMVLIIDKMSMKLDLIGLNL